MTEQEERQVSFQAFKNEVLKAIESADVNVDAEELESVQFARTYTELQAGVKNLERSPILGFRYAEYARVLRNFENTIERTLCGIEAEWLGIDLVVVI